MKVTKQARTKSREGLRFRNATLWTRSGFLARRFHQIHVAIFLEALSGEGVTPIQWGLMTVVAGQPGVGYGEIALALGIDRSNAADVSMRLAERGDDDKRRKRVFLTRKGQALMKRNETLARQTQEHLLDPLNTAERATFLDLLRRIVDHNNEFSRAPICLVGVDEV